MFGAGERATIEATEAGARLIRLHWVPHIEWHGTGGPKDRLRGGEVVAETRAPADTCDHDLAGRMMGRAGNHRYDPVISSPPEAEGDRPGCEPSTPRSKAGTGSASLIGAGDIAAEVCQWS